jgi:hypothetical protein
VSPATAFCPLITKSHAEEVVTVEVVDPAPDVPTPEPRNAEACVFCEVAEFTLQKIKGRVTATRVVFVF